MSSRSDKPQRPLVDKETVVELGIVGGVHVTRDTVKAHGIPLRIVCDLDGSPRYLEYVPPAKGKSFFGKLRRLSRNIYRSVLGRVGRYGSEEESRRIAKEVLRLRNGGDDIPAAPWLLDGWSESQEAGGEIYGRMCDHSYRPDGSLESYAAAGHADYWKMRMLESHGEFNVSYPFGDGANAALWRTAWNEEGCKALLSAVGGTRKNGLDRIARKSRAIVLTAEESGYALPCLVAAVAIVNGEVVDGGTPGISALIEILFRDAFHAIPDKVELPGPIVTVPR
jgi:hypothetical protein